MTKVSKSLNRLVSDQLVFILAIFQAKTVKMSLNWTLKGFFRMLKWVEHKSIISKTKEYLSPKETEEKEDLMGVEREKAESLKEIKEEETPGIHQVHTIEVHLEILVHLDIPEEMKEVLQEVTGQEVEVTVEVLQEEGIDQVTKKRII